MSFVIMSRLRDFAVRLVNLFRRERLERELDAELQAYLELEVQENIRRGMAPKDAKDSDGYKVVNCTRAQPVSHRFGRLARSKVISVTVLTAWR